MLAKKSFKKNIVWSIIWIFFVSSGFLFTRIASDIISWNNFKEAVAAGGCPWQDGGTITIVREPCILDTPPPPATPTSCTASCPNTTSWATACVGYIELDTSSQLGTIFITPTTAFVYSGGGVHPKAGDQYLACGASNLIPWYIGIPGPSAKRYEKIKNLFNNFIIAGKREYKK